MRTKEAAVIARIRRIVFTPELNINDTVSKTILNQSFQINKARKFKDFVL